MPKVEALNNFHYDGRMRTKGDQFEMPDQDLKQHIELKRVRIYQKSSQNSPVTQNRQLEGGVDKTTVSPQQPQPPATPRTDAAAGKVNSQSQVAPMSTEVGARDLVGNLSAARRATGKASNQGSTAAPAGATPSSNPKAGGKNDDGSPSK